MNIYTVRLQADRSPVVDYAQCIPFCKTFRARTAKEARAKAREHHSACNILSVRLKKRATPVSERRV